MPVTLRELLAQKRVLLADGATGTNLFNMGLVSGDAPELWNEDHPDRIEKLHQGFVDAGSDIILTNTFGCNRHRLKLHNAQHRARELSCKAAQIARKVADASGRDIVVAGSVGPTGELFEPLGAMTMDEAVASFAEQMEGLMEGGAVVAWIETMSAREEIEAATQAARQVGIDYVFTASFDTAGRTMMGLTPRDVLEIGTAMDPAPVAVGANCGVGATDLLYSVLDMAGKEAPVALVAKANCGVPRVSGDKVIYTGTPELMGRYAQLAIDEGATIIGGCCGTANEHLAAMREAIDERLAETEKRPLPTHEEIVAATGELVNKITPQGGGDAGAARRGRRSRSRG